MPRCPQLLIRICLGGLISIVGNTPTLAGAAPEQALEPVVKAAYLFNFLKFVEYPPGAGAPWICVFGEDSVGSILESAAKTQRVSGNTVRIRSLRTASQAEGCSLLYLAGDRHVIRAALAPLARAPVLTVSEDPEFLDMGGMILLYRDAGRLQFEINAQSMQRAGLRASSKLMLLSRSAR